MVIMHYSICTPWIYIYKPLQCAYRQIRLNLWGNNGREGHISLKELLRELNSIFVMPSDVRVPIHLFGTRCEVVLKRSEEEESVVRYTDVFYIDGSKTK